MQAVQNLGLAIVTIVSGVIVDKAGYLILEVFFLACLCIALIAGKVCTSSLNMKFSLSIMTRIYLEGVVSTEIVHLVNSAKVLESL